MVFYRIFIALAYILILAWRSIPVGRLGWDAVTGRERLFAPPVRPGTAPALWIHGASNGELAAARPVIERLARGLTGADLVITTNSRTARAMVQGWALPRTLVWLAPLDQRGLVRAFLDRQRPRALIMIENELWPNRLIECARRGIPILILGGRMSEKSFRLWQHLPGLARQLTATIRWLAPQDDLSRDRFVTLGVDPAHLGPVMTLKAATATGLPPAPTAGRSQTLLAASTHPGEEIALLDALAALLPRHPGLRLILAPRHPRRRDELEALLSARHLPFATRSRGQEPDARAPVYLADTLGEMDRWYRAAGLCFVGGSLARRGGHTPFEPAAAGSVILHGPDLENFAAPYRALAQAGAAIAVTDAASLARALDPLIGDRAAQSRLADAARQALAPFRDRSQAGPFFDALATATGLVLDPDQACGN